MTSHKPLKKSLTYKDSGVDIEAGDTLVENIKAAAKKTEIRGVLSSLGGFAGHFQVDLHKYPHPVIVSSTDGVGTKLKLAFEMQKFDGVGTDLVAMCVNDILCSGADPLFFLDYFATGQLDPKAAELVITGIARACQEAGCALLGGETAEMPGFYKKGEFDLAGFAVGVVNREQIIDTSRVAIGNKVIGIASSGIHSNGYSLVRKILALQGLKLDGTLGETLLTPTRIYAKTVGNLKRDFPLMGIAHITGGGLLENVPRILPDSCKVVLDSSTWETQDIFLKLKDWGNIAQEEMWRTFNCGVGLVLIVDAKESDEILVRLEGLKEKAWLIGEVVKRAPKNPQIEIL